MKVNHFRNERCVDHCLGNIVSVVEVDTNDQMSVDGTSLAVGSCNCSPDNSYMTLGLQLKCSPDQEAMDEQQEVY